MLLKIAELNLPFLFCVSLQIYEKEYLTIKKKRVFYTLS